MWINRFLISVLCLFSTAAMAVTEEFKWEQRQSGATTLNVPFRGGLLLLDEKRGPNKVQWIKFDLKVNDYFEKFPKDHIYVLVDSLFNFEPNPAVPYAGRGIIIDKDGIYFENFTNQQLFSFKPLKLDPNSTYTVIVHAAKDGVASWVFRKDTIFGAPFDNPLHYDYHPLPDPVPNSRISTIVIGALTDFSGTDPRVSANLTISNISQGRFVP